MKSKKIIEIEKQIDGCKGRKFNCGVGVVGSIIFLFSPLILIALPMLIWCSIGYERETKRIDELKLELLK